jgi:hypothetical protein
MESYRIVEEKVACTQAQMYSDMIWYEEIVTASTKKKSRRKVTDDFHEFLEIPRLAKIHVALMNNHSKSTNIWIFFFFFWKRNLCDDYFCTDETVSSDAFYVLPTVLYYEELQEQVQGT